MRSRADQVSAFGQEPWAQQALAKLRRDWPDWAFLVVRYRWLAMRGKHIMFTATGPDELRHTLSSGVGVAGAGPSGPLAAGGPPSGALTAERSGTGTWAVAAAGPGRMVRWPHGLVEVAVVQTSEPLPAGGAGGGARAWGASQPASCWWGQAASSAGPVPAHRSGGCRRLSGGMPFPTM